MPDSVSDSSLKILFLCSQPIYPTNSGPRILAFELIAELARYHQCDILGFSVSAKETAEWEELKTALPNVGIVRIVPRPTGLSLTLRRLAFFAIGCPVSVATYESAEFRLSLQDLANNYDIIQFDSFNLALFRRVASNRPTLLIPHDAYSMSAARGARVVRRWQAKAAFRWKRWAYERFEKSQYWRFTKVCPVGIPDVEWLTRIDPRIDAIPLEIPIEASFLEQSRQSAAHEPPHLVCCGFLSNEAIAEGVVEFLEQAYPLIRASVPNVRVTVWGSNPTARLQSILVRHKEVVHVGYVDDYHSFLASSLVYVYPQRYGSGIQTKLQQAMALGIPVVARSETLQSLLITSGVHAFECDDNRVMAQTISRLLTDPELRASIGGAAKAHVRQRYLARDIGRKLQSVYVEAIKKHQAGIG